MIRPTSRCLVAAIASTLTLCAPAAAQCEGLKLLPPVPQPHAYMGAVALGPEALVCGADGFRELSGVAHVFEPATGALTQVLTAADAHEHARFGAAVALQGGVAVIGAPNAYSSGSAYLFDVASGAELHRLLPALSKPLSDFGRALAIDGRLVAVGAPGVFPIAPDEGIVHVFDRASGLALYEIPSPDPSGVFPNTHHFGSALDLDGGRLLAGATGTDSVGAAHLFDAASGAHLLELHPPPGSEPGAFGTALDLHRRRAAVGDPGAYGWRGAVHVYDVSTGLHLYSVLGAADQLGAGFGSSVALDDRRLVVGAPYEERGDAQGVVHLYAAADGAPAGQLLGDPAATTHRFGASLDLDGARLAVGDVQDSEAALYAGAAYLFDVPPCP